MNVDEELEEQGEYTWSIDKAIAGAELQGCTIVRSDATHILLDIDNKESYRRYLKMMDLLSGRIKLTQDHIWLSKSGNKHIVIKCVPLPFTTRIALALALGSDPVREAFAIAMHLDGLEEPSVLFKPPLKGLPCGPSLQEVED